jgi:hypothetical protein
MEALRFFRHAGLSPVEANGGGGIGGGFGVGDFACDHDAALDGLGEDGLARLGVLIPAEGLAGQERVAEPLERDEGMAAALGFSEGSAEFFDAGVEIGGDDGFLSVVVLIVVFVDGIDGGARGTGSK